jgi:glycerol-3-phosphate dehydrogenase
LAEKNGVELPICEAVYRVLYEKADFRTELDALFNRSLKNEF